MAGASITIDYDDREVLDALSRLAGHVDDLSPVMAEIGEYLAEQTKQRFDQGIAPDGSPWAPLSPRYAKRKPKHKTEPLLLSEVLRDTIRYQAGRQSVEVGTDRIYAATHQFGRGPIPARPFLGISHDDQTEILQILRDYISDAL